MTGGPAADDSIRRVNPIEGRVHAGLACVKRTEPSYRSITKVFARTIELPIDRREETPPCSGRDNPRYEATAPR